MKFPNKTLLVLMVIFTLLNLCDVVTTMFIIRGESNPIFNMVGNIWVMFLFKFLVVLFIWIYVLRNLYPTNMSYFMMIAIVVYGCLALVLAQVININGILNPSIIDAAASVPVSQRTSSYFSFMTIFYLVPIFLSLLTFWLYDRSNKNAIINREIAQKNKWRIWKIQR